MVLKLGFRLGIRSSFFRVFLPEIPVFREALIKSAAVDGERFFVKTRFEKRGNTVCISRFSNRRIGGKDPSSAVGDLFRGSLGRLYMLGIQQATKMHQKKPEFHSYGPDMDLEQRQTQTGSSVRYRS